MLEEGAVINVTPPSPRFSLKLRRKSQTVKDERRDRGGENICRKDFAMGKGKSIYSGNVLGNRRGRETGRKKEKKGFRKDFTKANKQNKERKNGAGSGASKLAGWFPKRISLAYCRLKDNSLKKKGKTHSKAIGPLVKPIIAIATVAITLYTNDNDN